MTSSVLKCLIWPIGSLLGGFLSFVRTFRVSWFSILLLLCWSLSSLSLSLSLCFSFFSIISQWWAPFVDGRGESFNQIYKNLTTFQTVLPIDRKRACRELGAIFSRRRVYGVFNLHNTALLQVQVQFEQITRPILFTWCACVYWRYMDSPFLEGERNKEEKFTRVFNFSLLFLISTF